MNFFASATDFSVFIQLQNVDCLSLMVDQQPSVKPPLGEPVVILDHVTKSYEISGRTDSVVALKDIHLADDSPFSPVRKGEVIYSCG